MFLIKYAFQILIVKKIYVKIRLHLYDAKAPVEYGLAKGSHLFPSN